MNGFRRAFVAAVIFLFAGALFCQAESGDELFSIANKRYHEGKFNEAAKLYNALIRKGIISGNIYYNLGNAYYKMGKKGLALLNYERAKKFIPRNESLFANMAFLKSSLDVKQPKEATPLYTRIWTGIRNSLSIEAWFIISAILFFNICLILGIGFLRYSFRGKAHIISAILAFMCAASMIFYLDSYNINKSYKEGIITAPEADVRYSPSFSGVVAFKLVQGMRAQIIRRQGAWDHIRLNKDKSGWIESDAIEAIWE